jgi:hypothetical protein
MTDPRPFGAQTRTRSSGHAGRGAECVAHPLS